MNLREEASLILGFRLPDNPLTWEAALKDNSGFIDPIKKWNLTIMLLMRLSEVENQLATSKASE